MPCQGMDDQKWGKLIISLKASIMGEGLMLYGLAALINDSIMFINIYALQSRLSEVPLLTRTKFHSAVIVGSK